MKTVGFFSGRGGIGKTTLVYHLALMYQELGVDVVAIDLDPQADLTLAFLSENRILEMMPEEQPTSYGVRFEESLKEPALETVGEHLAMVPGGPNLGLQEYPLSAAWFYRDHPLERKTSHNLLTSFSRLACQAAGTRKAAIVLIDVAPGLSAINRAAFLACDAVVVALSSAPISFWNLPALGVSLRQWRTDWKKEAGPSVIV